MLEILQAPYTLSRMEWSKYRQTLTGTTSSSKDFIEAPSLTTETGLTKMMPWFKLNS